MSGCAVVAKELKQCYNCNCMAESKLASKDR